PHGDQLSFLAFPVPMRCDVQHILAGPPALIVIIYGLGKAAHVHDPEVTVDIRPAIGRRLTAIVETRPDKTTHEPRPLRRDPPPVFRGRSPWRRHAVIIRDIGIYGVALEDATRGYGAGHFGTDDGLIGMVFSIGIQPGEIIVETPYRDHFVDAAIDIPLIRSIGTGPRRVEQLLPLDLMLCNQFSRPGSLDHPLFVADAPHK